ncbi:ABC transporter permease [Ornithinimicrobium cerasi]|uniref:Transport permease protein n=1 Tax=Ornithinimicrobium cerasi TaxID=2248773 RepID=A0A285VW22_9MICO|nr:ABC transporter permease [Ornithinimicrobium cerasi]SOC58097.1 teichoic acid transport system permease protein [Ornithinimicrobium cerasi]
MLSAEEAAALARRHGLRQVGLRPTLPAYLRDVWGHRHLMWSMAKGEFLSQHQDNYLGILWAVINPILLGVSYYLIFGVLLDLRRDVDNFVSFLTIGLFTFTLISAALTSGSKAVLGKVGMMRALSFPRVLLPVVVVLAELVSSLPAFAVLLGIAVVSGEPVTLKWLLFPVALVIVSVMGLGMSMIAARVVHAWRDTANLVPLLVRLLRYVSGVFFSIPARLAAVDGVPVVVSVALQYQPAAVALDVVRETLMASYPLQWQTWTAASGWALLFLVGGFLLFWRGEGTYGRA